MKLQQKFFSQNNSNFLDNEFSAHVNYKNSGINNTNEFLRDFCKLITNIEGISPLNMKDFYKETKKETQAGEKHGKLGIRVDCCGSLSAALQNALIYKEFGISATFFINHNSNYFNVTKEKEIFLPHMAKKIIKRIAALGHEIGLHSDLLSYVSKGFDPGIVLGASLKKLGQLSGTKIVGSSAHNSAWAYGQENFEIFQEFIVDKNYTEPFELSMGEYGLTYEANLPRIIESGRSKERNLSKEHFGEDPIRSREFLTEYFLGHPHFKRGYDYETWLLGRDSWVFVDYNSNLIFYPITTKKLAELLASCTNQIGVALVHPEYVSADLNAKSFTKCI